MTHVALLGTGLLGSAIAERIAQQGARVTVWNRTLAKAQPLESLGIRVATTPASAVQRAARVHLVLRDDASVDDVITACGSSLRGTLIVDHSTIMPSAIGTRVERVSALGATYLHAPVFMGPAAARLGRGTMYVSGPLAAWEASRAALEALVTHVSYLGDRADLAAVYKLVGNAMILAVNAGLADAFAISQASGVAPTDVVNMFDVINPCSSIAVRGRNMAAGDYRASFEVAMARKDVQLMLDTAHAGNQSLHLLPAIADRLDALMRDGHAARDMSAFAVDTIPPTAG